MSKISDNAAHKFVCEVDFSQGNTKVISTYGGATMKLHGNTIASCSKHMLALTTQGWLTKTTKDRLNGILSKWGLGIIHQKKGKWFYNDYGTGREYQFEKVLIFSKSRTPEGYIKHLFVPIASF